VLGIDMAQDPVLRKAFRQASRGYEEQEGADTKTEKGKAAFISNYMMKYPKEYEAIFKSAMGSANKRGVSLASDTLPTALSKLESLANNPETTSTNLRLLRSYIKDLEKRGDQKEIQSALSVLNATY
tara:strand:+ start:110 stop:490 length:381 start_codon:yes stop_codon:yes gene_type:complete